MTIAEVSSRVPAVAGTASPGKAGHAVSQDTAGVTERIARFASGLSIDAIPAASIERAKDLTLDHLGVALLGSTMPWTRALTQAVLAEGSAAQSTIWGSSRTSPRGAALVNGTAGHAIELDDTHDESLGHPGCVVIPAAMALGESQRRSGRDVLVAIVAGYEAQCRIGSPLGHAVIARGHHPTATCGVFGAATAAGHLLGLDAAGFVSAFGSVLSMSSGTMQFSADPEGTMIKRMHGGMPAERGLLAALLAKNGFAGPRGAVEGEWGYARVFAGMKDVDLSRVTRDLGERFEIDGISVKLYPCCKLFHSLIEAIDECRATPGFDAAAIESIEPFGPQAMLDTHMEYRPTSTMSAQYSLPFTTAAAILLDPTDPSSFEDSARARADVARLSDRVKPVVDAALQSHFPQRFAGGVRITMRDGRVLSSTVIDSKSSPGRTISREDVQRKFVRLTAGVLAGDVQQRVVEAAATLELAESVETLAALLRGNA